MNASERNTQFLVEQACGPLDEILSIYKPDLPSELARQVEQCREILEQVLLTLEADPDNPDTISEGAEYA